MLGQLLAPAAVTLEGAHLATESRVRWIRGAGAVLALVGLYYLATKVKS